MNKEKILKDVLAKYPSNVTEGINVDSVTALLVVFHLGRMKEAGVFDDIETHKVTGEGFNLGMDLLEHKWDLGLMDIFFVLNDIFEGQNNMMLAGILHSTQFMSISEMKEKIVEQEEKEEGQTEE